MKNPILAFAMTCGVVALACAAFAQSPAAAPIVSELAGKRAVFALPEGMCAYDSNQIFDAQMLASLQRLNHGNDQLLLAFADCKDLDALRHGKPAMGGYSGQIVAPYAMHTMTGNYTRPGLVKVVTDVNKSAGLWKAAGDTNAQLLAVQNHKLAIGNIKALGIIDSEADFVSVATAQMQPVMGKGFQPVLSISTTTLLGVPVMITVSHAGVTPDDLQKLDAYSQTYVKSLLALNSDAVANAARHKYLMLIALTAIVVVGGFYWFGLRKRRKPV